MRIRSVSSVVRSVALILICALPVGVLHAQSSAPPTSGVSVAAPAEQSVSSIQQKIQQQTRMLHLREKAGASVHELGVSWALLGAEYGRAGSVTDAEASYNHALQLLAPEKSEAELYADVLDQLGALYRVYGRIPDAMHCYRTALAVRLPFGDPLEDARSRARLAELSLIAHHYKEAYSETDQAVQTMIRMHDPDGSDVVSALIVRAYALCGMHKCRKGEEDASEALKRSRADFPESSVPVGASLVALGSTYLQNGDVVQAEQSLRQAVEMLKRQISGTDPRLIFAMTEYHETLLALHRDQEAQLIHNELAVLASQPSCKNCTVSAFAVRAPGFSQKLSAGDHTTRATGGAVAWTLGATGLQAP